MIVLLGLCLLGWRPPAFAASWEAGQPSFMPQIVIPFGPAAERVGPGAGLDINMRRPVSDRDLYLTVSLGYTGFHGVTKREATPLFLLGPGAPEDASSRSLHQTQAIPFKVGVWVPVGPEYFLWAEIGDLYTRIRTRTEVDVGTKTRTIGDPIHGDHGVLLAVAGGLDKGTGLAGVRLSYSPAARGLHGQRHLAWLSLFVTL